jgi:hydrogenase expression/formation protein HypC
MCLAVPMKIVELEADGCSGIAEIGGIRRKVDFSLVRATLGQYVIVHAGFAISVWDDAQAKETLALLEEAERLAGPREDGGGIL